MTKIKICGIKRSEDAVFSASLGVDFFGLIFVRGSHRYLSVSVAKNLVSNFHNNTSNHDVKIVGVFANEKLDKIKSYKDAGCDILLDTLDVGSLGGTGRKFDWSVAQEISSRYPVWLAGGLDSSNVVSAIESVKPYAVDVSSGVETKKNKDLNKIKSFVDAARNSVTM